MKRIPPNIRIINLGVIIAFLYITSIPIPYSFSSSPYEISLTATISEYRDVSTLGIINSSTQDFDVDYDNIEPPSPPMGIISYFWCENNPKSPIDFQKLSSSYVPWSNVMNWTYQIRTVGVSGTVTIFWNSNEISKIPSDYSIFILNEREEVVADMEDMYFCFSIGEGVTHTFNVIISKNCNIKIITEDENKNRLKDVSISSTSTPFNQSSIISTSNSNGTILIRDIKSGFYDFQMERFGYKSESISVLLIADGVRVLTIPLQEKYGTLTVVVKDQNGKPLSGVTVTLFSQSNSQPYHNADASQDGSVTFSKVKFGNYTIESLKKGYTTNIVYQNVNDETEYKLATILEKEVQTGIDGFPIISILLGLLLCMVFWLTHKQ